jgi:hypothetical protein
MKCLNYSQSTSTLVTLSFSMSVKISYRSNNGQRIRFLTSSITSNHSTIGRLVMIKKLENRLKLKI